jgi:ubiquinone biosynthesis monooxygenase Coq7
MRHDEIVHGESARNAGGTELPAPAREAMRATSHVMTFTSYWV